MPTPERIGGDTNRDVVMNADLGTAQATETLLSLIGASAVQRIRFLMVDALRAAAFLKHKLKDTETTYADLAKKLRKHSGVCAIIRNKAAPSTMLQCPISKAQCAALLLIGLYDDLHDHRSVNLAAGDMESVDARMAAGGLLSSV